jgi:folate-dependent phosphoribosylglycinamide formyltransferase PurN
MLAGHGDSTNIVYHALARDFRVERVLLEDAPARMAFLKRRAKKLGVRKVLGQLAFRAVLVPALQRRARARIDEIARDYDLRRDEPPAAVVQRVSSVNDDETIEALRALAPAVVVVNGTRIISDRVLKAVPSRFINIHTGVTPLYRGVHGGYWALVDGKPRACGVTVHLVDEGIDTGGILAQALIEPTAADSFVTYPYLQVAAALAPLAQCVRQVLEGRVEVVAAPPGPSRLFSHPTAYEYLRNLIATGVK